MAIENKAGQRDTATWYKPIVSNGGEERRFEQNGTGFWCAKTSVYRTDRAFRDGIEGKRVSVTLASTNMSKIGGIDNLGGQVLFEGHMHSVLYAHVNENGTAYYIALE